MAKHEDNDPVLLLTGKIRGQLDEIDRLVRDEREQIREDRDHAPKQ